MSDASKVTVNTIIITITVQLMSFLLDQASGINKGKRRGSQSWEKLVTSFIEAPL